MPESYVVRVNRRDGVVEVSGPEKEWVDEKLKDLSFVFERPPATDDPKPSRDAPKPAEFGGAKGDKPPAPRKPKTGRATARSKRNPELEKALTPEVKKKLENYVTARRTTFDANMPAQTAILATFLLDELKIERIDHHDLYTVYSVMGWPSPSNIPATLVNAQQRNKYFTGFTEGKTELTNAGENLGRHGALDKK